MSARPRFEVGVAVLSQSARSAAQTVRCSIRLFERVPERAHRRGEVGDLLEMGLGELLELGGPNWGERDVHDALVPCVGVAFDQAVSGGAIDQLDGAVVAQHQVVGHIADRRTRWVGMAADREQQLVLEHLLELRTGLRHFLRWSEHQAKAAGLTPTRCGRFARPCGRGPCGLTRGGCPPGYM